MWNSDLPRFYILITSHETHERLSKAFEADARATDYLPVATATSSKAAWLRHATQEH